MSDRLWIWRHFRFALPKDWEMLQYTRDPAVGRCAFADRYEFRFEFSWRAVAGPPEFDRMMRDYSARLAEQGHRHLQRENWRQWRAVVGRWENQTIARFGGYFDRESCVVECVFLWPGPRDRALEQTVLGGFAEEPPDAAGRRRWRAFGLDLRVSGDLRLAECRVDPGETEWCFRDERGRRSVRCRRIGLRHVWMRQSVADWLRASAPVARDARDSAETIAGHAVVRRSGRLRRGGFEGVFRTPSHVAAEAWICPADDRLYLREIQGPARFVEDERVGGALRCAACGETTP